MSVKGVGTCVFSAAQGLQRVHDVSHKRNVEHLHHKSDYAIECLIIIAGFPEREDDAKGDDEENHERGE
jgi:hypothetical protein